MSAVHDLVRHAHYMLSVIRSGETLTTEEERQVRKACVDALMDAESLRKALVTLLESLRQAHEADDLGHRAGAWKQSCVACRMFLMVKAEVADRLGVDGAALAAHPAPAKSGQWCDCGQGHRCPGYWGAPGGACRRDGCVGSEAQHHTARCFTEE